MKKIFTLMALMACVLGAKAVVVVDAEVNFAEQTAIKLYGWGGSNTDRLSLQDGCLFYHGEEATENPWDVQFFPIGGVDVEVGQTYTLSLKIKGSVEADIFNMSFAGVDKYGALHVTTDWQELEFQYEATGTSGDLLFQCGSYVGDWWIEYMKITHEERDQRPVEWENILENGDAEGEYGEVPSAYSKEWGTGVGEDGLPTPHVAVIEDMGGNKVFAVHAKKVDPILVWDSDGEQWGQPHSAGDPMPDNTWQNQFWINFPRAMKADEQVKISFKYKASKDFRVTTQDHTAPGEYLGGGKLGDVQFSTDWQTFEKTFSAAAGVQSIAFNFGEDQAYLEDIDIFFDDLNVSLMKLDEGFFAACTNTESGLVDYDFDNAVEFTYDDDSEAYVATVGTKGKEETWVNELMISTVRGNDKAFKAGTLKVSEAITGDPDTWYPYAEGSNAKIKLPAAGVWTIMINTEYEMMNFVMLEGEEFHEPIEIVANPFVAVVNALERDFTSAEQEGGTGQAWDNQFWIVANRTLSAGEVTVIEFDYVASINAHTSTQCHTTPGNYLHWAAIGDVDFTTEEQHFSTTFTVPAEADGMQSIAFNMAEIKDACDYTIKNVIWRTEDNTETLINMEGGDNFYVKVVGGETYSLGIRNVAGDTAAPAAIYNLAGQRVTEAYKGIVVKNGKKVLIK